MAQTRRVRTYSAVLLALALASPAARAAISVTGELDDVSFRPSGTITQGGATRVLGASSTPAGEPGGRGIIYVFKLPTSDTGLPAVSGANFKFTVASPALATPTRYNIDLYAIPARTDPIVTIDDPYVGPLQTVFPPSGAPVRIVDNLLPANSPFPTGEISTPFPEGSTFVDFLNAQYGPTGAGAGKYIFLRLNPDALPPAEDTGGNVNMSEAAIGRPTLILTFVPEPTSVMTVLMFFGGTLLRRRTHRRD